jgi:ubiquinone/menaquinone biosynthesis C-methylase UbiE
MDPTQRFTTRAENYARYRWDYADAAIQAVCEIARLTPNSVVADVGSGTGLLTRHFVERAGRVVAIEPNAAMRSRAEQALAHFPAFVSLAGRAEAIPLPDHSVDLIAVGQALHWFAAEASKQEFLRILKPGGWLAVMGNSSTGPAYNQALNDLRSEAYGWDSSEENKGPGKPVDYYLGTGYQKLDFPTSTTLTWESFFGGLSSHSHAPQEDSPFYSHFREQARKIFEQFCEEDRMLVDYATKISIGQLTNLTDP